MELIKLLNYIAACHNHNIYMAYTDGLTNVTVEPFCLWYKPS